MKVLLYTKVPDELGHCPFCIKARTFLAERSIPYEETEMDTTTRQAFYDKHELEGPNRTIPQVFLWIDGDEEPTRLGGFQELEESGIESIFKTEPVPSERIHHPDNGGHIIFGTGDTYTLFNNQPDEAIFVLGNGKKYRIQSLSVGRFIMTQNGWEIYVPPPVEPPEPNVPVNAVVVGKPV